MSSVYFKFHNHFFSNSRYTILYIFHLIPYICERKPLIKFSSVYYKHNLQKILINIRYLYKSINKTNGKNQYNEINTI